jgi:hypothetical protein
MTLMLILTQPLETLRVSEDLTPLLSQLPDGHKFYFRGSWGMLET